MKKITLLGLSLLLSLGTLAQETKVIKDGKKVTKEQVEENKKKLEDKKKKAEKNAATAEKKQDKNVKEAKAEVTKAKNSDAKAKTTEVKSKVKKTAAEENEDLKQTVASKAAEKKVKDKATGTYKGKKVYTGPKDGKYYINKNGNKTYID
jgi:colicin import membrane protein